MSEPCLESFAPNARSAAADQPSRDSADAIAEGRSMGSYEVGSGDANQGNPGRMRLHRRTGWKDLVGAFRATYEPIAVA